MPVFKKSKTPSSENNEQKNIHKEAKVQTPKTKKKIRIGFGHKHKDISENDVGKDISKKGKQETPAEKNQDHNIPHQKGEISSEEEKILDVFPEDTTPIDDNHQRSTGEKDKEREWTKSKKKVILPKDMKGKPVYLEDTGGKIGIVFDTITDSKNNLIGYKIKDSKSESILSFPLNQFDEDKNGLIFVPSWYTKGIQTIEKLEFKDRISPELTWLITDNTITTEELYRVFVKHDDKIASYIEEAVALRDLLDNRLKILEKERVSLKESLMDLTEKRLIKDIDRREFSEIVMKHRQKVNVLDVNIKKCKELLQRLEQTSFGILSKNIISHVESSTVHQDDNKIVEEKKNIQKNEGVDLYREKYYELKRQYEELEEEHNELKIAVEKLLNKGEI